MCGILSNGGVHGHQDHLFRMIETFENLKKRFFYIVFSMVDSSPLSGLESMKKLNEIIKNKKVKALVFAEDFFLWIGTIGGRIEKAYKAIIEGMLEKEIIQ